MIGRQALRLAGELRLIARSASIGTFLQYLMSLALNCVAVVRTKSLGPADGGLARKICHFVIGEKTELRIPGEHIGLAREIIAKRAYDWPPEFSIRAGESVVDLGANAGVFSLYAAAQGASVVSVEAQDGFYPLLQHLFRLNGLEPPRVVHALVGSGTGVFHRPENRLTASHWGSQPMRATLAELIAILGLPEVDMLKVDIEGSEYDLFMNSDAPTLRRIKRITMEVHTEHGDVQHLIAHFAAAGFDVFIANGELRRVASLGGPFGFLYAQRRDDGRNG